MRSAITTVNFRSMDLQEEDICQLKLHGVNRWVKILDVYAHADSGQTTLQYKSIVGNGTVVIGEYELVRTQVMKDPA